MTGAGAKDARAYVDCHFGAQSLAEVLAGQ